MRATPRPTRRFALTAAAAAVVGISLVAAVSTAAHAADSPATASLPVVAAAMPAIPAETTVAPFVDAAAAAEADPLEDVVDETAEQLDRAEDAVAEAEAAAERVEASKLTVAGAATVDTRRVEAQIARLTRITTNPTLLVPAAAEAAAADTARVERATAALLDRLADAKAKKIAAAKKAAAAKAAAEAAAAAGSSSGLSGGSSASSGDNSVAGAKATARSLVAARGWGADQFTCLEKLWQKESGWNYRAYNSSSGAYGIPQALPGSKMVSAGSDWQTSAATQIRWGLGYIDGRYGTPCGAWNHSQSVGWY